MSPAEVMAWDSRAIAEVMAFDKIDPPDLWSSTIARLLYGLICQWSSRPPPFSDFLPKIDRGPMAPAEMRARLRSC